MPCRVSTIACSLQLGLLALAAASLLASPSSLSRDEGARCEGVVLTIEALARPDLEHALKIARPISTWSVRPDGTFLRPIPNVGCPARATVRCAPSLNAHSPTTMLCKLIERALSSFWAPADSFVGGWTMTAGRQAMVNVEPSAVESLRRLGNVSVDIKIADLRQLVRDQAAKRTRRWDANASRDALGALPDPCARRRRPPARAQAWRVEPPCCGEQTIGRQMTAGTLARCDADAAPQVL